MGSFIYSTMAALLAMFALQTSASASGSFTEAAEATLVSFGDRGSMTVRLENEKVLELSVRDDALSPETASQWTQGDKFALGIDEERGGGISDSQSGKFYKAFFPRGNDPIDLLEDACLERSGSTMGIANCYATTYRHIETDITYLKEIIESRADLDLDQFLQSDKNTRRLYQTLYTQKSEQVGGSIRTIEQWTTVLPMLYAVRSMLQALY